MYTSMRVPLHCTHRDIPLGLQLIRGENVVLLGEIDPSMPAPDGFTQVSVFRTSSHLQSSLTNIVTLV